MHAKAMAFVSLVISCLLLSSACARPDRLDRESADATDVTDARLAARESQATESGEGLQAPNRAHNLRTYFEPTGVRLHDHTASGSPELLRLSLFGVGRGNDLEAVGPGELLEKEEKKKKVRIRRPGLVEWVP